MENLLLESRTVKDDCRTPLSTSRTDDSRTGGILAEFTRVNQLSSAQIVLSVEFTAGPQKSVPLARFHATRALDHLSPFDYHQCHVQS